MISIGPGTFDVEWNATAVVCPMSDSTTSDSMPVSCTPAWDPPDPPPPPREEVWPIRPRKDMRQEAQRTPVVTIQRGYFLHRQ